MVYLLPMPLRIRTLLAKLPIERFRNPPAVVAVLRLSGIIAASNLPLRAGTLSLSGMARMIERAFETKDVKAVALAINSPGGSPVQSALIQSRIRQLAQEKKVPVFAFAEDVAASGGYWLALAADEIFADPNSILGSIGVISSGFGFADMIARFGIERRVHTQGERKSLLDPFKPERPEEVARLERLQKEIYESFVAMVRERRGSKLVDPEGNGTFSGDIFTGRRALEAGLIDGLGDLRSVMRARFGDKVKLKPVAEGGGWLRRRLGFSAPVPSLWIEDLLAAAEGRALWARYGL
ncbi:MAG TPA: S49 family peptidase [Candidatus Cybelea sp.]|nr:S49 family peptidase [Candidatus Cybelea sp.]